MKVVILFSWFVIVIIFCATALFVSYLQPPNVGVALVIEIWLTSPYVVMTAILILILCRAEKKSFQRTEAAHLLAVLVSVGGILFLALSTSGKPDVYREVGVLLTPICQDCAFGGGLLGLVYWFGSAPSQTR